MIELERKLIRNTEKVYPTFSRVIVFKQPFEVNVGEREKKKEKPKKMKSEMVKHLLQLNSLRRTKTTIKDIILCNDFDLFCTFTFKDHRQDIDICKARMQYWLQSQQKQHGTFDYLIVPEFHADGESLHFHALFGKYGGKLIRAINPNTKEEMFSTNGRKIYNFAGYRNGNNTAIPIDHGEDDLAKVASYVTKYITKDMPVFHGKKRYWVSQSLGRPLKTTNISMLPYLDDENVEISEQDTFTVYTSKK